MPELLSEVPENIIGSVLAVKGKAYEIYLADCREREEPGAGETITGTLVVDLPEGDFSVSCYSPESGLESPAMIFERGQGARFELPPFKEDIVVRIKRSWNSH